jgi:hypothetical protein
MDVVETLGTRYSPPAPGRGCRIMQEPGPIDEQQRPAFDPDIAWISEYWQ